LDHGISSKGEVKNEMPKMPEDNFLEIASVEFPSVIEDFKGNPQKDNSYNLIFILTRKSLLVF